MPPAGARAKDALVVALLCGLGLAVLGRCVGLGYLSDDFDLLGAVANPHYHLWSAFPVGEDRFRPLVTTTFWLATRLGSGPALEHALNLGLHVLNASLVFAAARCLGVPRLVAAAAAALFVVHPANVTDACWLSGRGDLLCTAGYLTVLICLERLRPGAGRWWAALGSLGLVTCLASKEMALTLPVEALLWWLLTGPRAPGPERRLRLLALGATTAGVAAWGGFLLSRGLPATEVSIRSVARALAGFVALAVLPVPEPSLAPLHRLHPQLMVAGLGFAVALCLLGLGWTAWRYDRRRALRVALWCAAVLVPVTPLTSTVATTGARLIYLPLAVGVVLLSAAVHRLPRAATGVLAAACLLCAVVSFGRCSQWVANDARARRLCDSFRGIIQDVPAGAPILVLTYPWDLGVAPVFSNDLTAALTYCATGVFGERPGLSWAAGLSRADTRHPLEVSSANDALTGTFRRTVRSDGAWLDLTPAPEPGVTVRALAEDPLGRTRAVEVTLAADLRPHAYVLDAVGESFSVVSKPTPQ